MKDVKNTGDKKTMKKVLKTEVKREIMPISKLIEYDKNNKAHWEKQIDTIANSINRFSYYNEIIIDKNNVIIAWHWRLKAIKKMWYDWVEVKKLNIDVKEAWALRILDNLLNNFDSEDNLENIVFELDNWIDLSLWDLWREDFLPELSAPEFNPDDYLTNKEEEEEELDDWSIKIEFTLPNPDQIEEVKEVLKQFNVKDIKY